MKPRQKAYCPGGTIHTIVAGDTYYKLAQQYNTTVDAIRRANPGVDEMNLQIGYQLCIPVSPPGPGPVPYSSCCVHTIVQGDTFYKLAQRYNTTVDAIQNQNWCLDPYNLQIGQQICIPVPHGCPDCVFHTIVPGDTMYRLAQQYNTTVEAIRRANPCADPHNLLISRKLCIPVSSQPAPGPYIGCRVHTIRAGDTYYKLAQRYNTSAKAIEDQNWCLNPNELPIGKQICIPLPYANPGCVYHTVVKNDTFYKLAQHYHTTVNAIRRANPCADEYNLRIGEKLCIPRN